MNQLTSLLCKHAIQSVTAEHRQQLSEEQDKRLATEKALADTKIHNEQLEKSVDHQDRQIASLNHDLDLHKQKITALQQQLDVKTLELQQAQQQGNEQKTALKKADDRLEHYRTEMRETTQRLVADQQTETKQLQQAHNALNETLSQTREKNIALANELKQVVTDKTTLGQTVQKLQQSQRQSEDALATLTAQRDQLQLALAKTEQQAQQQAHEHQLAFSLKEKDIERLNGELKAQADTYEQAVATLKETQQAWMTDILKKLPDSQSSTKAAKPK